MASMLILLIIGTCYDSFFHKIITRIFFKIILATVIIVKTIEIVNFDNKTDLSYCDKTIYMVFYWSVIMNDIFIICISVHASMNSCTDILLNKKNN